MSMNDFVVMSVAGLDPSGGAGLIADCKTFEAIGVKGVAVNTANTVQTDKVFFSCEWLSQKLILSQLNSLLDRFKVSVVKIGIIEHIALLQKVIDTIKRKCPATKIIWDPVLKASSGYQFHSLLTFPDALKKLLPHIDLITPNYEEIRYFSEEKTVKSGIKALAPFSNVLLTGGHREALGVDELYLPGHHKLILPPGRTDCTEKHGSGCVLSAAIAAYFHFTRDWEKSCRKAKAYTENYLASSPHLIGKHR